MKAVVFFIAAAAAVGCKSKPSGEASESAAVTVRAEKPTAAPETPAQKPEKPVLRGPGLQLVEQVGDWKLSDGPRYFGPDTLYDLINGGAEVYVAYGLKEMATSEYRAKGVPAAVTVEVYDLSTPLGAFGRFSKFLDGKREPAAAAVGVPERTAGRGMLGSGGASFWKGAYLVNLTLLDESPEATLESTTALGKAVLPKFIEAMDTHIQGETALPEIFSQFPEAGQVAMSLLYEKKLWNIDALGAGFAISYAEGKRSWQLFVTEPLADTAAAKKALAAAKQTLSEQHIGAEIVGKRIAGYRTFGDEASVAPARKGAAALVKALQAAK